MAAELAKGEVKVVLNDKEALARLRRFEYENRQAFDKIGRMKASPKLDLDKDDFDRGIKAGEAELAALRKQRATAVLKLDTKGFAEATAKIAEVEVLLKNLQRERKLRFEVDADTRPAISRAEALTKTINQLRANPKIELDQHDFDRARHEIELEMDKMRNMRAQAVIRADVQGVRRATTELVALKELAEALERHYEIKVDVDRSNLDRFQRALFGSERVINSVRGSLLQFGGGILNAGVRLGPLTLKLRILLGVMTVLASTITSLGGALGALTAVAFTGLLGVLAVANAGLITFALGLGGVAAVVVPLVQDFKKLNKAVTDYDTAVLKYGADSKQATDKLRILDHMTGGLGRTTAKAVKDFRELGHTWRRLTAPAKPVFFKLFADGIKTVRALMPQFAKDSTSAFKAAARGTEDWLKGLRGTEARGIFHRFFHTFNQTIGPFQRSLGNIITTLARIGDAARPLFKDFINWFDRSTQGWADATKNGEKTRSFIKGLADDAVKLGRFFGALGHVIGAFFFAGRKDGGDFLTTMTNTLNRWAAFLESPKGHKDVHDFLTKAIDLTKTMLSIVGHLIGLFVSIGHTMAPFVNALAKAADWLLKINGIKWLFIAAAGGLFGLFAIDRTLSGLAGIFRLFQKIRSLKAFGGTQKFLDTFGATPVEGRPRTRTATVPAPVPVGGRRGSTTIPVPSRGEERRAAGRFRNIGQRLGGLLGLNIGNSTVATTRDRAPSVGRGVGRSLLARGGWRLLGIGMGVLIVGGILAGAIRAFSDQEGNFIAKLAAFAKNINKTLFPGAGGDQPVKPKPVPHYVRPPLSKFPTDVGAQPQPPRAEVIQPFAPGGRTTPRRPTAKETAGDKKENKRIQGLVDKAELHVRLKIVGDIRGQLATKLHAVRDRVLNVRIKVLGDRAAIADLRGVHSQISHLPTLRNIVIHALGAGPAIASIQRVGNALQRAPVKAMDRIIVHVLGARAAVTAVDAVKSALDKMPSAYQRVAAAARAMATSANASMRSWQGATTGGVSAIMSMLGKALRSLGIAPKEFGFTVAKKAAGGFLMGPRHDHIPALLGGDEAVVNRHQQEPIQRALAFAKAMGESAYGSMQEVFGGVRTPNYLATGGFPKPRRFAAGGVAARANTLDKMHVPYKWGGHHGDPLIKDPSGGLDCSSAISYVLNIPPRVAAGFMNIGKPGKGPITIFARPSHVFASIGGRGFGTSDENEGGGPGWLSYNSRPGFTVRNVSGAGVDMARVKKVTMRGAQGGLKRVGQRSFDKLRGGANRKLDSASLGGGDKAEAAQVKGRYSAQELAKLWKAAGGPGGIVAHIAGAVAYAESTGNRKAHNRSGASGLWQILGQLVKGNIFNPMVNAKNAVAKWRTAPHGGRNFTPWVQYTNNAYKKFMARGGFVPKLARFARGKPPVFYPHRPRTPAAAPKKGTTPKAKKTPPRKILSGGHFYTPDQLYAFKLKHHETPAQYYAHKKAQSKKTAQKRQRQHFHRVRRHLRGRLRILNPELAAYMGGIDNQEAWIDLNEGKLEQDRRAYDIQDRNLEFIKTDPETGAESYNEPDIKQRQGHLEDLLAKEKNIHSMYQFLRKLVNNVIKNVIPKIARNYRHERRRIEQKRKGKHPELTRAQAKSLFDEIEAKEASLGEDRSKLVARAAEVGDEGHGLIRDKALDVEQTRADIADLRRPLAAGQGGGASANVEAQQAQTIAQQQVRIRELELGGTFGSGGIFGSVLGAVGDIAGGAAGLGFGASVGATALTKTLADSVGAAAARAIGPNTPAAPSAPKAPSPAPSEAGGAEAAGNTIIIQTLHPGDSATLDAIGRAATKGIGLQGSVVSPRVATGV